MEIIGLALAIPAVLVANLDYVLLVRWYATVALCCFVGVFWIFFQVGVGDALYGPDGFGGPFSQ
jgi:hypothetical protein